MAAVAGMRLGAVRGDKSVYLRQTARYAMIDYLRWTHAERFCSLDVCLEGGYDVVEDDVTGTPRLVQTTRKDKRHGGVYWAMPGSGVWAAYPRRKGQSVTR